MTAPHCPAKDPCRCHWSPLYGHATACPQWERPPAQLRGLLAGHDQSYTRVCTGCAADRKAGEVA